MSIKLVTLNIEGSLHLHTAIPFLEKLNADVVCLQEVFAVDFPQIKEALKLEGEFFPIMDKDELNAYSNQDKGLLGVAFLTKLQHSEIKSKYYFRDGPIPKFRNGKTVNHVLVHSTVKKDGKKYTIGTTHFPWTPDGEIDEDQRVAYEGIMTYIKQFDSFILCGDFNAPRGREMFAMFETYFTDNVPKDVETTLDPSLHKNPSLRYVVDTIFSTKPYVVKNVKVVDKVSDHMAIVGDIKIL